MNDQGIVFNESNQSISPLMAKYEIAQPSRDCCRNCGKSCSIGRAFQMSPPVTENLVQPRANKICSVYGTVDSRSHPWDHFAPSLKYSAIIIPILHPTSSTSRFWTDTLAAFKSDSSVFIRD